MRPNPLSGSSTTPVLPARAFSSVCVRDLVWSGSIGACQQNYSACRSTRVSAACQPSNQMQRCDKSQPHADALSAHHPLRNAGSTLSADKEHSIRYYACTDVLRQQSVTGCRRALPAISTCPEDHTSEIQARLRMVSSNLLNPKRLKTVGRKALHQQNVRDSFTFVKSNLMSCRWALTSFPCTSKIGSLLLPC